MIELKIVGRLCLLNRLQPPLNLDPTLVTGVNDFVLPHRLGYKIRRA